MATRHQLIAQLEKKFQRLELPCEPIGSLLNPVTPTPVPQKPRKAKPKRPTTVAPKQVSHTHKRQPVTKPRRKEHQANKPKEITATEFFRLHPSHREDGALPCLTKKVKGGYLVKTYHHSQDTVSGEGEHQ